MVTTAPDIPEQNVKSAFPSIAEQGVISLANLLVNLAFVYLGSKADYGEFAVLNSYLALAIGIQAAVIGTPMTVYLPRINLDARAGAISTAFTIQWRLAGIAGLIGGAIAGVILRGEIYSLCIVALSFAVAFVGVWQREYARTIFQAQLLNRVLLLQGLAYGGLVLVILAASYGVLGTLRSESALFALGSSGLIIVWAYRSSFSGQSPGTPTARELAAHLLPYSKWALPGVIVVWLQNSLYLTICAAVLGREASAELAGARLFIMPFLTLYGGYSRFNLTEFSHSATSSLRNSLTKKAIRISGTTIFLGGSFSILLWLADQLGLGMTLPAQYREVLPLAATWGGFAIATSTRGVWTNAMLAVGRFREVFFATVFSTILVLLMIYPLMTTAGLYGAVCSLAVGETVLCVIIASRFHRAMNND